MPEENMTQEEVRNSIKAAFDSVNLINGIVAGTQMQNESIQEKKDTIERNVGHLNIMNGKTWFTAGLTGTEDEDIDAAISDGNDFIAAN